MTSSDNVLRLGLTRSWWPVPTPWRRCATRPADPARRGSPGSRPPRGSVRRSRLAPQRGPAAGHRVLPRGACAVDGRGRGCAPARGRRAGHGPWPSCGRPPIPPARSSWPSCRRGDRVVPSITAVAADRRSPVSTEGGVKAVVAALWPTSGSRSASSSRSRSPARRPCCPRRSTPSPTPATRCCCSSGASARRRAPTRRHQFGYGRRRYVYGFIVAIVLFLVGGLFSLYEGLHKFHHPEELSDAWIAFLVLLIAIVLEGFSFRTAAEEANQARGEHSRSRVRAGRPAARAAGRSCWRTPARWSAWSSRWSGVSLAVVTGDGRWDGIGRHGASAPAGGHRGVPGVRDGQHAGRGERPAGGAGGDPRGAGVPAAGRPGHPPAHPARRARRAAGRGQDRHRAGTTPGPRSPRGSTRPSRRCAPPSPRRGTSSSSPTSTGPRPDAAPSRHPVRRTRPISETLRQPRQACRRRPPAPRTNEASCRSPAPAPRRGATHASTTDPRLQGRRPVAWPTSAARRSGWPSTRCPGLMAMRARVRRATAAAGRPHHRLAAHDRADRRAHRDAGRARAPRSAGRPATSSPPRTTPPPPSPSAPPVPSRRQQGSPSTPGRARRCRSTGGAPSRCCCGPTARAPT